jgi:hypothetical protein
MVLAPAVSASIDGKLDASSFRVRSLNGEEVTITFTSKIRVMLQLVMANADPIHQGSEF